MTLVAPLDVKIPAPADSLWKRTALEETTGTLRLLIDRFEKYGSLDKIDMAHAYEAEALGRAILALDRLSREADPA